jgi:hypothetical protein
LIAFGRLAANLFATLNVNDHYRGATTNFLQKNGPKSTCNQANQAEQSSLIAGFYGRPRAVVAWPLAGRAQQTEVLRRVGMLMNGLEIRSRLLATATMVIDQCKRVVLRVVEGQT